MENLEKELVKATAAGSLYDFIAEHYYEMSKHELKEVLLAVLGVGLDQCGVGANRDIEEEAYAELLVNELESRDFGIDDED